MKNPIDFFDRLPSFRISLQLKLEFFFCLFFQMLFVSCSDDPLEIYHRSSQSTFICKEHNLDQIFSYPIEFIVREEFIPLDLHLFDEKFRTQFELLIFSPRSITRIAFYFNRKLLNSLFGRILILFQLMNISLKFDWASSKFFCCYCETPEMQTNFLFFLPLRCSHRFILH